MSKLFVADTQWTAKELHVFRFLNIKRANGLNNSRDARRSVICEYHDVTSLEADKIVDKWLKNYVALQKLLTELPEHMYIEAWVGLSCGQMESARRAEKNKPTIQEV